MLRLCSHALSRRLWNLSSNLNRKRTRPMSNFQVVEHVVRCQHTRDRPAGAERGRDSDLRMHVKQYIPKTNPHAKRGDVTLIGAQANAFPKEMYEPLWDDIYERMQARGRNMRSIWIADMAPQGHSGVINETLLGPDCALLISFSRTQLH